MEVQKIVVEVVYNILKQQGGRLSIDMITPEKSLIHDLNADSLHLLEIIMEFEKKFNIAINIDDAVAKINTIEDICNFLQENLNEAEIELV